MNKENSLERAKAMLYGPQVDLKPDDGDLGPANALLYVAKFQRLAQPKVEPAVESKAYEEPVNAPPMVYRDKSKLYVPKYTETSIVLGHCTE